jgi:hypothetical protein
MSLARRSLARRSLACWSPARLSLAQIIPVIATGLLLPSLAHAAPVTVTDNYYGALNTYNNADVIGDPTVFDISSAVFQRVGLGGNTLEVTINTAFAGKPGTSAADGTGYGALFLTPGAHAWQPTGTAPYPNDSYRAGEWTYAATMPMTPSNNATSGTGGLYTTGGGALGATTSKGTIVASNVNGNTITYPNNPNSGYYFRQGQAVQFTPSSSNTSLGAVNWSIGSGTVTFDITDNHLLGNDFAFSWAMTCANDVIQGQVDLGTTGGSVGGVPEPSTWALILAGFAALGFAGHRRARAARI